MKYIIRFLKNLDYKKVLLSILVLLVVALLAYGSYLLVKGLIAFLDEVNPPTEEVTTEETEDSSPYFMIPLAVLFVFFVFADKIKHFVERFKNHRKL